RGQIPRSLALGGWLMSGLASSAQANYLEHPEAQSLIRELGPEEGFQQKELEQWLSKAEKKQNILDAIARPAEKTKTWKEYRPIFNVPARIDNGVKFWRENQAALTRAEQELGRPAEYIIAIIGVEKNYGRNTGSHRAIDA